MTDATPDTVEVFIDGFNVYYGLKEAGLGHLRWLDYVALAKKLNSSRIVSRVHYFTARVKGDSEAAARQSEYLDALYWHAARAHPDVIFDIYYGRIQFEPKVCDNCNETYEDKVEKNSDVNLAVAMVAGAYTRAFDCAMLLSGDADQVSAVKAVMALGRQVRVVFPPMRDSSFLKDVASTAYFVKEEQLKACLLPKYVDGYSASKVHECPPSWL